MTYNQLPWVGLLASWPPLLVSCKLEAVASSFQRRACFTYWHFTFFCFCIATSCHEREFTAIPSPTVVKNNYLENCLCFQDGPCFFLKTYTVTVTQISFYDLFSHGQLGGYAEEVLLTRHAEWPWLKESPGLFWEYVTTAAEGGAWGLETVTMPSLCVLFLGGFITEPRHWFPVRVANRLASFIMVILFPMKGLSWLKQHCFLLGHECILYDRLELAW